MSTSTTGQIGWVDLTVPDADTVRAFYEQVVGWRSEPLSMGDYDDFVMMTAEGEAPAGGICHARGSNAGLPPVWLVYITVDDLDARLKTCKEHGGTVVADPRSAGGGRYAVIRDPAGAVCALYEEGANVADV